MYVPLDPNYPAERLSYMLTNGNAHIILTNKELAKDFMDDSRPLEDWNKLERQLHDTIEMHKLLSIEKATVEKE